MEINWGEASSPIPLNRMLISPEPNLWHSRASVQVQVSTGFHGENLDCQGKKILRDGPIEGTGSSAERHDRMSCAELLDLSLHSVKSLMPLCQIFRLCRSKGVDDSKGNRISFTASKGHRYIFHATAAKRNWNIRLKAPNRSPQVSTALFPPHQPDPGRRAFDACQVDCEDQRWLGDLAG